MPNEKSDDLRLKDAVEIIVDDTDLSGDNDTADADHAPDGAVPKTVYADPQELIGVVLNQKYEIESLVGQGGMGCVYRARHLDLNRTVAVKVLHKHLVSHQGIADRFRQEAKAAHALRHANLAAVTDFGFADSGEFFLVMDFVEGETLAGRIKNTPLDMDSFIKVFTQVLSGLKFCHQKGIVHRDIKPGNILLTNKDIRPDTVKLVDFGIAKVLPGSTNSIEQLTQTGELLGSPQYMSPEQCRGDTIDERTDLYSLGCVMYESLTGRPPFQGKSAIDTLMMHCSEPPPALSLIKFDDPIEEQLQEVINKSLSKDRDDRYKSAEEMEEAISGLSRLMKLPKVAQQRLTSPQVKKQDSGPRNKIITVIALATLLIGFLAVTSVLQHVQKQNIPVSNDSPKAKEALDELNLGLADRTNGNLGAAQGRLTRASKQIQEVYGKESLASAIALYELGSTDLKYGRENGSKFDNAKARNHLTEVVEIINILKAKNPDASFKSDVISMDLKRLEWQTILQLANAYYWLGKTNTAGKFYEQGMDLMGRDTPPKDAMYHDFWEDYANYLWHRGREWEATKIELLLVGKTDTANSMGAAPAANIDINGAWSDPHIDFMIQLQQNGKNISGSHYAPALAENKVDGSTDADDISFYGMIRDNGLIIGDVESSFEAKDTVCIVPVGDYVVWKVVGVVQPGEAYYPPKAILSRGSLIKN